jgi:hypothetical protein
MFVLPEKLVRLLRVVRRVYRVSELSEKQFAAIEAATYPSDEEIKAAGL